MAANAIVGGITASRGQLEFARGWLVATETHGLMVRDDPDDSMK